MKFFSSKTQPKNSVPAKEDLIFRRITFAIIALAAVGLLGILLRMPAIPELVTEEEFKAKNQIFSFDENQSTQSTKQLTPEPAVNGQMGKRDAAKISNHYGIKGPAAHNESNKLEPGISGTGRGGGGTGEGFIGLGALNTIGHGGGGGSGSGYGRGYASRRSLSGIARSPASGRPNTEKYQYFEENDFLDVSSTPLSTFSIDVDSASYANMRRFITNHLIPPKDAIRIEELVNYFTYDYPAAQEGLPFSTTTETTVCPWNETHLLTRIGLRAKQLPVAQRGNANLVFLIDVSGSMTDYNKLPLLKRSMALLLNQLSPADKVAIVVYAGGTGLVLDSTPASQKATVLQAIEELESGGSTNGGEGIVLAYKVASEHFIPNGINRVILATDGDFNMGVTSHGELTRLITSKRKTGVYLSVLGFGEGNYNDAALKQLSKHGNGNYAYIDSFKEAQKVLVKQLGSTLTTVADDVKIQVEFNPAKVHGYRLLGYENRLLAARDFNNDKKDAGEMGEGQTVTALYELIPVNARETLSPIDPLRYQKARETTDAAHGEELYILKMRYKPAGESQSIKQEIPVPDKTVTLANAPTDLKFAASVAGFGMLLRDSKWVRGTTYDQIQQLATAGLGTDAEGLRREFVSLIEMAKKLTLYAER